MTAPHQKPFFTSNLCKIEAYISSQLQQIVGGSVRNCPMKGGPSWLIDDDAGDRRVRILLNKAYEHDEQRGDPALYARYILTHDELDLVIIVQASEQFVQVYRKPTGAKWSDGAIYRSLHASRVETLTGIVDVFEGVTLDLGEMYAGCEWPSPYERDMAA